MWLRPPFAFAGPEASPSTGPPPPTPPENLSVFPPSAPTAESGIGASGRGMDVVSAGVRFRTTRSAGQARHAPRRGRSRVSTLRGVEPDRERAVVDELDRHYRTESARRDDHAHL